MKHHLFSWYAYFSRDFTRNIGDIHGNHANTPTAITALHEEAV
jgi:hypothetical protein